MGQFLRIRGLSVNTPIICRFIVRPRSTAAEATTHGNHPSARLAIRLERSAAILTRVDAWLGHHRVRASVKSPFGEALAHIAKYRDGLSRFLTDGHDKMDSDTVERTMAATLAAIVRGHKRSHIDDLPWHSTPPPCVRDAAYSETESLISARPNV